MAGRLTWPVEQVFVPARSPLPSTGEQKSPTSRALRSRDPRVARDRPFRVCITARVASDHRSQQHCEHRVGNGNCQRGCQDPHRDDPLGCRWVEETPRVEIGRSLRTDVRNIRDRF